MSVTNKLKLTAFVLIVVTIATIGIAVALPKANAAVVKVGSRGQTVKTIQTKLKRWGYYNGSIDGIFGNQTKSAVQYFQRKNGLTVDGDRKSVV